MPPVARSKAPHKSAMLSQPAQKTPVPPAPPMDEGSLRPRRRRVSALLAEKRLASAERRPTRDADNKSTKSDATKATRRRTIYVPSDDTTIITIHPGGPQHARRPASPDLGFDLVTLSEDEPQNLLPSLKPAQPPRNSVAAAPKRGPLQKSSRPVQGVSFVEDVVGKSLGKENIPPGMLLKTAKRPPPSIQPPRERSSARPCGKPEPTRSTRPGSTAPANLSAARTAVTRKRTSSDSVCSPSKALRTARAAAVARPPLQEPNNKRQTRFSTCNPSSSLHASTSPPRALRRHRVAKPPSKLGVPRLPQDLQDQARYPVLYEDLDNPELYEDSWLNYQEVSITQLVNNLFDCAQPSSQDQHGKGGCLRRNLLTVYQDPTIALLHKRLQASLTYGALSIPKDLLSKTLRLKDDIGLRRKFLNLFVNTYEPPWLRAAAEAVVGRECQVPTRSSSGATAPGGDQRQQRAEQKAIEGFLDTFFIRHEDTVRVKTGFGGIASIARGGRDKADDFGSQDWSWRRTTLRSLMLILLLDMAKSKGITGPPLFQVTSSLKSSHAVLQELAGMVLPPLGDILRPLGHLDYHLHCVQYPLQEYKYHIGNLATDLRDGVLLTRLVELLLYPPTNSTLQTDITVTMPTGNTLRGYSNLDGKESWVLSQHLKFPCAGRVQKQYNVQIALSALEGARGMVGQVLKEISAEDIVDGHREKTLGLLWSLVGKWGLEALVDWTELERETQRYRKRYYNNQHGDYRDPDTEDESELVETQGLEKHTALLRGWAYGIARCCGLHVANLTTSFADGRVLDAIVTEYLAYFPMSERPTNGLPAKLRLIGCSSAFVSLFKTASTTTNRPIPSKDFTVTTLAFLASRLLQASRVHHAASTLQRWDRTRLLRRQTSKRVTLMRLAAHCATVVQTRGHIVDAAIVLQRAWRNVLGARIKKLVSDVTGFQALARGWAVRSTMPKGSKKSGAARKFERIRGGW